MRGKYSSVNILKIFPSSHFNDGLDGMSGLHTFVPIGIRSEFPLIAILAILAWQTVMCIDYTEIHLQWNWWQKWWISFSTFILKKWLYSYSQLGEKAVNFKEQLPNDIWSFKKVIPLEMKQKWFMLKCEPCKWKPTRNHYIAKKFRWLCFENDLWIVE